MNITVKENISQIVSDLSDDDAAYLASMSDLKITRLPWKSGYEVLALNVIGALSLPSGRQIFIESKLPLPNVFRMLSYVSELYRPIDEQVEYKEDTNIYEIMAQIFNLELEKLLRKGLKQNYSAKLDELGTIRGRIDFNETIRKSSLTKEKIGCRFWQLSLDHPLNQAIAAACQVLLTSQLIGNETRRKLSTTFSRIPSGMISANFKKSDFNKIHIDRSIEHYSSIIHLSKMVLNSLSYTNMEGAFRFPGFMLKMYALFEKYIEKSLLSFRHPEIVMQPQVKKALDLDNFVHCKPDYLFNREGSVFLVADAKYKDFSGQTFDESNVYQILAYLVQHNCSKGFLLFPKFNDEEVGIIKTLRINGSQGEMNIYAICIDLESPEMVSQQIHKLIPQVRLVS